jgi:hypothetical protein
VVSVGRNGIESAENLVHAVEAGVGGALERVDAIGGDLALGFVGVGAALVEWLVQPCTPAGSAVPTGLAADDVVIVVAGLGSSSTSGAGVDDLDVESLGIDPANVIRASYVGGRIPVNRSGSEPAADLAGLPTSHYTEADSTQDLRVSAANVAALVDAVAQLRPGARIHLIAHSQGGIVAVEALRSIVATTQVDVITISSPHQGAQIATAGALFEAVAPNTAGAIGAMAEGHTGWDPTATSVQQLASTSGFMDHYGNAPLPSVPITSIGCWNDLVVPATQIDLRGATEVTLRTAAGPLEAHGEVVADPVTTIEVARALHRQAPTCQSFADMAVATVVSSTIAGTELVVAGSGALVGGVASPGG